MLKTLRWTEAYQDPNLPKPNLTYELLAQRQCLHFFVYTVTRRLSNETKNNEEGFFKKTQCLVESTGLGSDPETVSLLQIFMKSPIRTW